jgi:hypothetical protein
MPAPKDPQAKTAWAKKIGAANRLAWACPEIRQKIIAARFIPLETRFWQYVNKTDGCWLWTGSIANRHGYGRISIGSGENHRVIAAHRLSWEIHSMEPIPSGMFVLHRCDNPPCVRPDHLFLGTQFTNMSDASSKRRLPQQRYPGMCAGEKNGRAKLTDAQVREIRILSKKGFAQRKIAKLFNVSRSAIGFIQHNKMWTHVS